MSPPPKEKAVRLYGSKVKCLHWDSNTEFLFQVFVGKIPRDLYEDELVPLFEKAGPIWDLRLMMDPLSGQNRGYAFITFCGKEAAQEAVKLVCDKTNTHRPVSHYLRELLQLKLFAVNIVLFSLVFSLNVFILTELVCDLCSIFF